MNSIYLDDDGFCKNCGAIISKEWTQQPNWDGDTCSEECATELDELDLPWGNYEDEEFVVNDDYLEYTDEDLVPDDDRQVS